MNSHEHWPKSGRFGPTPTLTATATTLHHRNVGAVFRPSNMGKIIIEDPVVKVILDCIEQRWPVQEWYAAQLSLCVGMMDLRSKDARQTYSRDVRGTAGSR